MTTPSPAAVLTSANSVTCNHSKPGSLELTTSTTLRVGTAGVLVAAQDTVAVVGCKPSSNNDVVCVTATITGGRAAKLRVGGKPVALASMKGTATGTVEGLAGAITVTATPAAKLVAR